MKRSEMICLADGLFEQRNADGMDHFSICVIDSATKRIAEKLRNIKTPQDEVDWFLIRAGAASSSVRGRTVDRETAAPLRGFYNPNR